MDITFVLIEFGLSLLIFSLAGKIKQYPSNKWRLLYFAPIVVAVMFSFFVELTFSGFPLYRQNSFDISRRLCYDILINLCGGSKNDAYQDHRNPQPVRQRQERRLRRVPDLLPVRLQDQLRRGQPEVREREQGREKVTRFRSAAADEAAAFFCERPGGDADGSSV